MVDLLLDLLALLLLFVTVRAGWVLWVVPCGNLLDAQAKGLLGLVIVTAAGGAIGSLFWWMAIPISFSWQLPPLAFRMLGAAGVAFAVVGIYVLQRRRAALIRAYFALLAIYLLPLVAASLLLHRDRFDWRAPVTYAFFIIAAGLAAAAIWHITRRTALPSFEDANSLPPPSNRVRVYLSLVAVIFGVWGLILFVFPSGKVPQIWVWPQDPLTTRLIAAMLQTIGTAGILGCANVEAVRMSACMCTTYGAGVTAACLANLVVHKPLPLTYAAAFAILALTSLPLLVLPPRRTRIRP